MHDKLRALEMLAKHLGMLKEQADIKQNIIYRVIYEKAKKALADGTPGI